MSVLACVLAATAAFTFTATPMYGAVTLLRVERSGPNVIDIAGVDGEAVRLGAAGDYYNTQYAVLASRMLALSVLEELGIERSEQLTGPAGGPWPWLRERIARVLPPGMPADPLPADPLQESEGALVDRYLRQLVIEPVPDSRLVRLRFSAPDPQLAARIADAHARAYIRDGQDLRTRSSREAGTFLEQSLAELRGRVEKSQQALAEFRRAHDIVSLDDKADVVIDRLAEMNQQLSAAQSERIAREADMQMVKERRYESLIPVIQSDLIRALKEEIAPLEIEYAALKPAVTPAYSGLRALRARIEQARTRIDLEIGNIVDGIESAYLSARHREEELRAEVERQKQDALRVKDESVEYSVLKQDVQTALGLYDSVRQRIEETTMVSGLASSNVSIVDPAYASPRPVSPRKRQSLVLGALVGICAGLGLGLLREVLDGRLRGPRDVSRHLQLRTLGVVPCFRAARRARTPGLSVLRHPLRSWRDARSLVPHGLALPPGRVQEIYRAIRTDLQVCAGGEARVLLFSSARPGEGKTTTALQMSIAFARLGSPVLLIDADLRRPSAHRALCAERAPGLVERLTGDEAELRKIRVLERDLFFLPAGSATADAAELLGSARMRELLGKLRDQFEFILIDGPPLTPISDAVVLSTMVDGVVLVVDPSETPRQLLKSVCARLALARSSILGVVLNRTEPQRGAPLEYEHYC